MDADVWELYDITTDFSQAHDLAAQHPEKQAELKVLFEKEAWADNVFPRRTGATSARSNYLADIGDHLLAQALENS